MTTKTIDELKAGVRKLRGIIEHRERGKVELRAASDGRTLDMFIPYGSESVDMGFREVIDPSAFTRSIRAGRSSKQNDIFALWSHDSSQPLARQANDTLTFDERDDGLRATAILEPKIDYHKRTLDTVGAGLVRGTSFGFETVKDEWLQEDNGDVTRTLLEVKLFEVSPVVFPAYQESDVDARSVMAQARSAAGVDPAELLGILRDVKDGKAPLERREALQGWVQRLEGFVPEVPPVAVDEIDDRMRRVRLRERLLVGKA